MKPSMHPHHYTRLIFMIALSFVSMFILMYAMVDRFTNVYSNLNQFYMAGLMTAPMVIIELTLMAGMYSKKALNFTFIGVSTAALVLFWILIRNQTAISDEQFLKSMIPHHASAILMCEKAPISDPEIKELCEGIISSQQGEINWMKAKLNQ